MLHEDFEILTDAEWGAYCRNRWIFVSITYLFLAFFFSFFFGGLSFAIGDKCPAAQPYQKYITGAVIVIVCASLAYSYYRHRKYCAEHYEKIKTVSVTNPESGSTKTYAVVHLRYLNNPPIRLSFFMFGHISLDEVTLLYRRQILYVQDPETEEIFGYCPKCHELMEFKFIPYGVCPNCGKFFRFYDSH